MANTDENQREFSPAHRIIGAVILISLAVIMLPAVLNKEAMPERELPAPSDPMQQETRIVVTPIAPVESEADLIQDDPKTPAQKPELDPPAGAAGSGQSLSSVVPADKAPSRPAEAPSAPETQKPSPQAAPVSGSGWVLQLGTYSNPANVARLRERLEKHGYRVLLESTELKNGKATRVRVGPFDDKAEATNIQARVQKQLGLKGVVLRQP